MFKPSRTIQSRSTSTLLLRNKLREWIAKAFGAAEGEGQSDPVTVLFQIHEIVCRPQWVPLGNIHLTVVHSIEASSARHASAWPGRCRIAAAGW
jgi:hypothetical protein